MKVCLSVVVSLFALPALLGAAEANVSCNVVDCSDTNLVPEEITITATRITTPQEKSPTAVTVSRRAAGVSTFPTPPP